MYHVLRFHMSPRWGLSLEIRIFYKHAAPLGLKELRHRQPPKSPTPLALLPILSESRVSGLVRGETIVRGTFRIRITFHGSLNYSELSKYVDTFAPHIW